MLSFLEQEGGSPRVLACVVGTPGIAKIVPVERVSLEALGGDLVDLRASSEALTDVLAEAGWVTQAWSVESEIRDPVR